MNLTVTMKQLLSCLCFLLLMGCLPKEAKQESTAQKSSKTTYASKKNLSHIKVGYCTPTLDGPFYVALEDAVKNAVKAYGMQYLSTDGQGDINKQVMAVDDLLSKGIQILVLNPLDPKALVPIVKSANGKGVMVFILDSTIEDEAPYISSVVANNQLNGELLGLWLAEQKKADLKIAIISGNQGNPVGREKRLGFVRGLADGQLHGQAKTNFQIVAQGWGGWNNNGGLKAMEDILVAHPEVNTLLAENDAMALGALKVIKQMGKSDAITVLAFDGQKEAYVAIKNGEFAVTALNSPKILGETMIEVVARHLNEEETARMIYTPSVLINKQKVDQYYDPKALF